MSVAFVRQAFSALVAGAALFGGDEAIAQGFDANIVTRVESFVPPPPKEVLPTKTESVPVTHTEEYTVTVEETRPLTLPEREARAKDMGIVVPLGLRSTTARKAYLNLRKVPTEEVKKVKKTKTRKVTKIVERTVPRNTQVTAIASLTYTFASNANLANVDIVADGINSQNANLLVLVPAGRTEDTVAFTFGPTSARYGTLGSSSFDALNGAITYTRLLGRRQTMEGFNTAGTSTTDLLSVGVNGTSVYEPGFGSNEIVVATPSFAWTRTNIGLGNKLCGAKGSESFCYYANVSANLGQTWADITDQIYSGSGVSLTLGWRPPVTGLSVSVTGSVQAAYYLDYPGNRQDLVFVGSGDLSWAPSANVSLGAGLTFTQQLSSQADLGWNGFTAYPQVLLSYRF